MNINKVVGKNYSLYTAICFCFISIFMLGNASGAQKPAAERAQALTNSMNCELHLLPAQLPIINAINLKASLQMDTAYMTSKEDARLLNKKGTAIDRNRNIELRDALTPKQFATYERISKNNQRVLRKTLDCRPEQSMEEGRCNL